MNIIQIFSTPLWESPLPDFDKHKADFHKDILAYRQENPRGDPMAYVEGGGYQGSPDLTLRPAFGPLFEYIAQISMKASFDMQLIPGNIYISRAWAMVMDSPVVTVPDQVISDTFTGVFFLEAPANSGKIQLKNAGMNALWQGRSMIDRKNRFNALNLNIDPDPGMIFVWPSYLSHSIAPNRHDGSMIAIFFTSILLPKMDEPGDQSQQSTGDASSTDADPEKTPAQ